MGKTYRIAAVHEPAPQGNEDPPKSVYTLVASDGGPAIRVSMARRGDWRTGDVVRIDEATVMANRIE